ASNVSGKTGSGIGVSWTVAVHSTTDSPNCTRHEPCACRAIRPVSRTSRRPANVRSILCIVSSCRYDVACGRRTSRRPPRTSVPEPEIFDQLPVAVQIFALQVLQQPPPLANHLHEAAPAVVVLRVRPEVFREVVDPRRQQCDLHRRASAVIRMELVLLDDLFLVDRHLPRLLESLR